MKRIFILFFFPLALFAQYNDAGLWLGINAEKKISRKFSFLFNPEIRFNENITEAGTWFLDEGISCKVSKNFRLAANYRYAQRRQLDNTYENRHRFYFDFSARKKITMIIASYRLRYQFQYNAPYRSEDGLNARRALRNKVQLKYGRDGKLQPFASGELWYSFDYKNRQFDSYRVVGGVDYEINKFSGLTLSYLFQKEFGIKNPVTDYIISLGYNYSF